MVRMLQNYLRAYDASYYTHNGQQPLHYAVVLLLSLQFRQAVEFMGKDPSTSVPALRDHAAHLAAALIYHRVS